MGLKNSLLPIVSLHIVERKPTKLVVLITDVKKLSQVGNLDALHTHVEVALFTPPQQKSVRFPEVIQS